LERRALGVVVRILVGTQKKPQGLGSLRLLEPPVRIELTT
jgi:hypothetical protein